MFMYTAPVPNPAAISCAKSPVIISNFVSPSASEYAVFTSCTSMGAGKTRIPSTSSSMAPCSPSHTISTVPSSKFLTWPAKPSFCAIILT